MHKSLMHLGSSAGELRRELDKLQQQQQQQDGKEEEVQHGRHIW
jgi:hypothetical protein